MMAGMPEEDLLTDVPWKLVAASPDMMDTRPRDRHYPFRWRSSLAFYAYEPPLDQIDPLCDERITLLKVSCTITGYQPNDVKAGTIDFPGIPTTEVTRAINEYFGCYGVQLNVAVFPPKSTAVEQYPHIVDFEPKTRDLYQAATQEGEILTASKSQVTVGESFTHTESVETGIEADVKGKFGVVEAGVKLSHKWGEKDEEKTSRDAVRSREGKESNALSTQLNQMYNLLTGYHSGTNRAVFLMLPRPHVLQPTDRPTFVRGLRLIEGIQDFFLVVARRKDQPQLTIEATLETGHFPDEVERTYPDPHASDEKRTFEFEVGPIEVGFNDNKKIETYPMSEFSLPEDWQIDLARGDPAHPGVDEIRDFAWDWAGNVHDYQFRAIDDTSVHVYGRLDGPGLSQLTRSLVSRFQRLYRVYARRQRPGAISPSPVLNTPLLITSRSLAVTVKSGDKCMERVRAPWSVPESIVDEAPIRSDLSGAMAGSPSAMLEKIKHSMLTSFSSPTRRPDGIAFTDSDWFKDRMLGLLPQNHWATPVSELTAIPPKARKRLGDARLGEVMSQDMSAFMSATGLNAQKAVQVRRKLLGLPED